MAGRPPKVPLAAGLEDAYTYSYPRNFNGERLKFPRNYTKRAVRAAEPENFPAVAISNLSYNSNVSVPSPTRKRRRTNTHSWINANVRPANRRGRSRSRNRMASVARRLSRPSSPAATAPPERIKSYRVKYEHKLPEKFISESEKDRIIDDVFLTNKIPEFAHLNIHKDIVENRRGVEVILAKPPYNAIHVTMTPHTYRVHFPHTWSIALDAWAAAHKDTLQAERARHVHGKRKPNPLFEFSNND